MELTLENALQKAIEAHKAGKIQEAEHFYKAILQAQPKHPDANHNMGVLAVSVGKLQGALPFFKAALKANPSTGQFWLSYIEALIKLGRIAEAKVLLNQAKDKGANGEVFDQLGWQLGEQRLNGTGANSSASGGSSTLSPNILDTTKLDKALRLAKRASKDGQFEKSKNIYEDILQKFPKHKQALAALPLLAGVASLESQDPSPVHLQAIVSLFNHGQLQQAISDASQMLERFPNSATLYNIIGVANVRLMQFDAAIKSFNQTLKINPDYAEAYNNMGNALKAKGDPEAAIKSYKQALKIRPGYAEAYSNMGIALKDNGDIEAAIDSYKEALKIKPDYAEVYNNIGNVLKDKGDLEAAIENYNQAVKIKPNYAEAHNNSGNALSIKGDPKTAIDSYNKAITINPDYAEAYYGLGIVLKCAGREEQAEVSFKQAIRIKPNYAEAHYDLGMLLLENSQYGKAAEHFTLSGSENSGYYLLRCLYLQDEKTSFYDHLDHFINQGDVHPMIGSLSCRSALRYGIERPNLFCKNPLNHVLKTNLTDSYDFKKIFVEPVEIIINEHKVPNKKQDLLTNGFQTFGNLFALEPNLTEDIQKIIRLEVDKYLTFFKDSEEGLITSWPSDYSLNGWLVTMKNGGNLRPHMHEEGWISGSIYINVPPKSKTGSGNLVVCIEEKPIGEDQNQEQSIDVVTGSLCLFPASLLHYTIPFESKEDRIVLAFDVVRTG